MKKTHGSRYNHLLRGQPEGLSSHGEPIKATQVITQILLPPKMAIEDGKTYNIVNVKSDTALQLCDASGKSALNHYWYYSLTSLILISSSTFV